jgi:phage shock protein E
MTDGFCPLNTPCQLKNAYSLPIHYSGQYSQIMHWFTIILIIAIVLYLVLPKLKQASLDSAAQAIRDGAPLIDVRTAREFSQQSVPGSVNMPLGQLKETLEEQNISTSSQILVFCLSGTRSAAAERQLKAMGYRHILNIGSYGRAKRAWQLSQTKQGEGTKA